MSKKMDKGFTLIELVIVIAILGILMAIAVPAFSGVSKTAKMSQAKALAAQVNTYVRSQAMNLMIRTGNEQYPAAEDALLAAVLGGSDAASEGAWADGLTDAGGAGSVSRVVWCLSNDSDFCVSYAIATTAGLDFAIGYTDLGATADADGDTDQFIIVGQGEDGGVTAADLVKS